MSRSIQTVTRSAVSCGSCAARRGRPVGIYACGPTVYAASTSATRARSSSSALLKRFLEHEGYDVDARDQRHRRQRQDLRRGRGAGPSSAELAAEMTAAYLADTDALGLGRPDARAARERDDRGDRRGDRDAASTPATPTSPTATSTSACARDAGYGALSRRDLDEHGPGRGRRGRRAQGGPARLRAVEGAQGRARTRAWDAPWGPGRPGWHIECSAMAEEPARRRLRHPRRRLDLLFPHHENEAAQTRCARGARARAHLDAQRHARRSTGEKMAKSVGNIALLHEVLDAYGPRRRRAVLRLRALPPAARVLRRERSSRRARASSASARRRGALSPGDRRPSCAGCATASSTRSRATSTRRGARGDVRMDSRGERPLGDRVGDARPARDARRARRSRTCSRRPPRRRRTSASWPRSVSRRAPSATSRAPTRCARRSRRAGWEVRDEAGGFELPAARDRLRAQRRARGAARAPCARRRATSGRRRRPRASRG